MVRIAIPTLALAATTVTALSKSKGFNLVAHVADPGSDLSPSVEGLLLTTAHTGAGFNAAVFADADAGSERVFYQNGTAARPGGMRSKSTLLTDGGTPPFPFSMQVQSGGEPRRIVDISVGQGTSHYVDARGRLVNAEDAGRRGSWLACNAVVPYYNETFTTLQYAYDYHRGDSPAGLEGCAAIELVARCAELNDLPDDAYSTHEFAVEVRCEK
ncbi:hypothetical protein MYCTH_2297118 [Thermothelomyces thermophilus ATCC 42464]|uniref:DUF7907 domain-containing protein n=1 Tax=Thermothelomyces thermophilus (strain ATCC 42464 / BCRC 31852 / DSM 1799) TaxID=573729 RepID=G2Q493_THET4|nr:uncharacterized protein MYCTH_2297118 [Thermothelomyces thermophilus ATCC 42464]AEO54488.1 hypothetical protein MYCTH_2297118 [Thermothelomyces thermophilus ATCC 42464]